MYCTTIPTKEYVNHLVSRYGINNYPLYNTWRRMVSRCNNPKNSSYAHYGERGIKVCREWANPFNFYVWAESNGFDINLSLDRINNNKGYSPSNCRFVNRIVQNNNRRRYKNNTTGYTGVCKTKFDTFQARINIGDKKVNIGNFPSAKEAAIARDIFIDENKLPNKKGD